jgi:hypothetical protein
MPVNPRYDPTENRYVREDSLGNVAKTIRTRVTLAQINAGFTLLAAPGPGFAYQVEDVDLVAVGGAAAGATAVVVSGTIATVASALLTAAIAGLTQSTRLRDGQANATVLADGASFAPLDANTAITIAKTGSALTGVTAIDVVLTYSLLQV